MDIEAVLFLLSLFVMVGAVRRSGLFEQAARALTALPWPPEAQLALFLLTAGVLTGVFSAGPSMAALLDVAEALARTLPPTAVYVGLALSVCAGSSLFLTAATSGPMAQMLTPDYAPVKDALYKHVAPRLDWIADRFTGDHLLGNTFSVADAYLFVCLNWSQWNGIDLSRWPGLEAFMQRVGRRPAVLAALRAEGLAPWGDGIFFAPALAA